MMNWPLYPHTPDERTMIFWAGVRSQLETGGLTVNEARQRALGRVEFPAEAPPFTEEELEAWLRANPDPPPNRDWLSTESIRPRVRPYRPVYEKGF